MFQKNPQKDQIPEGHYDHLAGIPPHFAHLFLFIGVLSFSLTVLITLFSAL